MFVIPWGDGVTGAQQLDSLACGELHDSKRSYLKNQGGQHLREIQPRLTCSIQIYMGSPTHTHSTKHKKINKFLSVELETLLFLVYLFQFTNFLVAHNPDIYGYIWLLTCSRSETLLLF